MLAEVLPRSDFEAFLGDSYQRLSNVVQHYLSASIAAVVYNTGLLTVSPTWVVEGRLVLRSLSFMRSRV